MSIIDTCLFKTYCYYNQKYMFVSVKFLLSLLETNVYRDICLQYTHKRLLESFRDSHLFQSNVYKKNIKVSFKSKQFYLHQCVFPLDPDAKMYHFTKVFHQAQSIILNKIEQQLLVWSAPNGGGCLLKVRNVNPTWCKLGMDYSKITIIWTGYKFNMFQETSYK